LRPRWVMNFANQINEFIENNAGIVFRPRKDWNKATKKMASTEKSIGRY